MLVLDLEKLTFVKQLLEIEQIVTKHMPINPCS